MAQNHLRLQARAGRGQLFFTFLKFLLGEQDLHPPPSGLAVVTCVWRRQNLETDCQYLSNLFCKHKDRMYMFVLKKYFQSHTFIRYYNDLDFLIKDNG